jgi:hypothetical protein
MTEPIAVTVAEVTALFEDAVETMKADPEHATTLQRAIVQHRIEYSQQMRRMPAGFDDMPWSRQRALMIADQIAAHPEWKRR